MATVKDVLETYKSFDQVTTLFGATAEVMQGFGQRIQAIGQTICNEAGITYGIDPPLPSETALGPKAAERFKDLLVWLRSQPGWPSPDGLPSVE